MVNKIIDFLYNFDLLGPNPKLYIFNKERYQSIFSLVISLLIIILTISFILYSLIMYIENDRPTVVYSKSNDENEQRKIFLKDTLLMLQFTDSTSIEKLNESIISFEGEYISIFDNATSKIIKLNVSNCKLGYNLNSKYEKFINDKFKTLSYDYDKKDKDYRDFYCINNEDNNINIFYYPNIGYSSINLDIILKKQSLYSPEDISVMMIYENNLINHDDKNAPISEGIAYQFIQGFSFNDLSEIDFNFQYLKYETDDGLLFENQKYLNGMSFLDVNYFKNKQENNNMNETYIKIGSIKLEFNKSNFDYFRRTYKKLPALLAEISSVISLLFEIGRQILEFSSEKKMSIDIINNLFNIDNQNKKNKKYNNNNNGLDRIKMTPEKINNSFKLTEKIVLLLKLLKQLMMKWKTIKKKYLKKLMFSI